METEPKSVALGKPRNPVIALWVGEAEEISNNDMINLERKHVGA
jgi:hypothetical protein